MSRSVSLILGSHNHIPYGIGDDEFEEVYNRKLRPFIVALNRYPKIPMTLHYSGVLLHWIERNHPEFFMLIVDMVSRKQVEMLGGGFYEPLLPLLPIPDKIGQVEMLTTYLRSHFNKRPQGCWLPALAWEQNMVGVLNTCGMGYTFMNEALYTAAGLSGEALYAPCISEDQGKLVTVFPLSDRLNAELKRKRPFDVVEAFSDGVPAGQNRLAAVFPEFFFACPQAESSPEERINGFFEDLSRAESLAKVEFSSPGRLFKNLTGLAKAYFPSSTQERKYPAINELCEEPEAASSAESAEAGSLLSRQFLINYPESNGLYSKMMFTHVLINQLRGDKSRKRTAREELWKAQGYDALCYGGGGGIYRNNLRNAAYKALLGAEKITRDKGVFIPAVMNFDFDLDGEDEYLFQDEILNCYIKKRGASVFELDYLPKSWNYLDTLARRRELAFGKLPSFSGPEDRYRRAAFADRLTPPGFAFADALAGRFGGSRLCAMEPYDLLELDKTRGKVLFRLPPRAGEGPFENLELEKTYTLKQDMLTLRYRLTNRGDKPERGNFITDVDLAFPGEGPLFQRIYAPREERKEALAELPGTLPDTAAVELQDLKNEVIISLGSDRKFDAWINPIRTWCRIGGKMTDQYQSTCVSLVKKITLNPRETLETEFCLRMQH
jgi:hypothetical protein